MRKVEIMEKKIIYNVLYALKSVEEQQEAISKLKRIPDIVLDSETHELILVIDSINKANRLATPKALNTFFSFSNSSADLESYLWDVDEEESLKIDINIAIESFIKEKEIEANQKEIEKAFDLYSKTGNTDILKTIPFIDSTEENLVIPIQESVDETVEYLRRVKNKEDVGTINFSNSFFNTQIITKGIEKDEFVILAARPAVGKTALALALINDISKQGKKVLFITLEMSKVEVIRRMLISKTAISDHTIRSQSKFTDEKFDEIVVAGEQLKRQNINIVEESPRTFIHLREIIKKEHAKSPVDIVFVDYLSLIDSYDGKSDFNKTETVSRISRGFKLLAKEIGVPMFVLQQTSRAAAQGHRGDTSFKELQLSDLRDSGALEQDANKVFLLWNKEPENEEEEQDILDSKYKLILSIAKNRNGQAGQKVLLSFNKTIQRIKEIAWLTKPSSWTDQNE